MAVGVIAVTEGSGKNIHTHQRSISAVNREDQYIQQGESAYDTYSVTASGISAATSADHILQIMSDGTNYFRVKRVEIRQVALAGAAGQLQIQMVRTSTAGTGGAAVTPRGLGSETYAGAAMTLPTAKGTEGAILWQWRLPLVAAQPVVESVEWLARLDSKPPLRGTSVANGIVFKVVTGVASVTVDIIVEMTVTSYSD